MVEHDFGYIHHTWHYSFFKPRTFSIFFPIQSVFDHHYPRVHMMSASQNANFWIKRSYPANATFIKSFPFRLLYFIISNGKYR